MDDQNPSKQLLQPKAEPLPLPRTLYIAALAGMNLLRATETNDLRASSRNETVDGRDVVRQQHLRLSAHV